MKTLLLIFTLLLPITATAGQKEHDAAVKRIKALIHSAGYRCDTVTDVTQVSNHFVIVICNGWDGYEYHVRDRGGRITVEAK